MALDPKEAREVIVAGLTKKSKTKSKFYLKDFYKFFPEEKPRAVKKIVNEMVQEEILEYWSSGSTTMIGLKGVGKQAGVEEGEE
ncbi:MAG: dissimilatory sulfite reductase-asociated protein DsvD [Desulfobacterales bacterium]|nr:dissimilatory sulfite reductase-asociated protein DsvD [Desulfobacterales bacterium]MCP4160972.1 dissimilatory sulfite reductase-asociated protein DsvD [Deltaproteobacteria bacterium]